MLGIVADLLEGDFTGAWEKLKQTTKEIDWITLYEGIEMINNPMATVTRKALDSTGVFDGLKRKWEELKTNAPVIWENIKDEISQRWEELRLTHLLPGRT